jgi:hypothetical protein
VIPKSVSLLNVRRRDGRAAILGKEIVVDNEQITGQRSYRTTLPFEQRLLALDEGARRLSAKTPPPARIAETLAADACAGPMPDESPPPPLLIRYQLKIMTTVSTPRMVAFFGSALAWVTSLSA